MAGDDEVLPIPNLKAAQYQFTLSTPTLAHLHTATTESFLKAIEADGDHIYYLLNQLSR